MLSQKFTKDDIIIQQLENYCFPPKNSFATTHRYHDKGASVKFLNK